jgi:hypothetical protein
VAAKQSYEILVEVYRCVVLGLVATPKEGAQAHCRVTQLLNGTKGQYNDTSQPQRFLLSAVVAG